MAAVALKLATDMARNKRLSAILLAGGRGTRLRPVLSSLPKPLAPVAGRPFLEWVLLWLAGQGVDDVVIATGYLGKLFAQWLDGVPRMARPSVRLIRELRPLGTGGGVLNALRHTHDRVLVANGDSLVLTDLKPAVELLEKDNLDGVLLGVDVVDGGRYGSLEVDVTGRLLALSGALGGSRLINAGVYLFRHRTFARAGVVRNVSLESELIPGLIAAGARLAVHRVNAPFIDIGTPQGLEHAGAFVRHNRAWFPEPEAQPKVPSPGRGAPR
jgi:D-glycero-alpha-D-manno-heptose 1-phosphate guanylyltransferase